MFRLILRVAGSNGARGKSLRSDKPMRFFRLNPRCSARGKGYLKTNPKSPIRSSRFEINLQGVQLEFTPAFIHFY